MEKKKKEKKAELRISENEPIQPRDVLVYTDGKYMCKNEYEQFLYEENKNLKEENDVLRKRVEYVTTIADNYRLHNKELEELVKHSEEHIKLLEEQIELLKETSQLQEQVAMMEQLDLLDKYNDLEECSNEN